MLRRRRVSLLAWIGMIVACGTLTRADEQVVLKGETAQVSVAVAGGGIVEFRFLDQTVNPLNWEIGALEQTTEGEPYLRGHFLCLDRWGASSEAEQKHGVPFHGEAPRVVWSVLSPAEQQAGHVVAKMSCELPLAGMSVQRTMSLDLHLPLLTVTEAVTRGGPYGRIYNMVQHPSIAPPFLDETTIVDSNASYGFWQDDEQAGSTQLLPSPWPRIAFAEKTADLREFHASDSGAGHDVSSFVINPSQTYGWVTACNPGQQLLLGYLWRISDYPWLNIWRYQLDGKVAARGLEFGTTGYHQPFAQLVKTGSILGRPLYVFLDADETVSRSYVAFLLKIPRDYEGVGKIVYDRKQIVVSERRRQDPRTLSLDSGQLLDW